MTGGDGGFSVLGFYCWHGVVLLWVRVCDKLVFYVVSSPRCFEVGDGTSARASSWDTCFGWLFSLRLALILCAFEIFRPSRWLPAFCRLLLFVCLTDFFMGCLWFHGDVVEFAAIGATVEDCFAGIGFCPACESVAEEFCLRLGCLEQYCLQ